MIACSRIESSSRVLGIGAVEQPEHLWTLDAQPPKKIEPDAANSRQVLSEPWVGYRLVTDTP